MVEKTVRAGGRRERDEGAGEGATKSTHGDHSTKQPVSLDGGSRVRAPRGRTADRHACYNRSTMARHPRRLLVLLMVLVATSALLGSATTALAHVRSVPATPPVAQESAPAVTSSVTASPAPDIAPGGATIRSGPIPAQSSTARLWAALVLALLAGVTLLAPRRVLIVALVLVLAVIAVEEGVHSVHHLADQRAASHCAVAAASAHVQGAAEPIAVPEVWIPTPIATVVASEPDRPGSRPLRPDEGRAPPTA